MVKQGLVQERNPREGNSANSGTASMNPGLHGDDDVPPEGTHASLPPIHQDDLSFDSFDVDPLAHGQGVTGMQGHARQEIAQHSLHEVLN